MGTLGKWQRDSFLSLMSLKVGFDFPENWSKATPLKHVFFPPVSLSLFLSLSHIFTAANHSRIANAYVLFLCVLKKSVWVFNLHKHCSKFHRCFPNQLFYDSAMLPGGSLTSAGVRIAWGSGSSEDFWVPLQEILVQEVWGGAWDSRNLGA